jgi:hypothetical protein
MSKKCIEIRRTEMKYLLFIVLLVAVVITAGCVGGNQNTPVTPTIPTFQTLSNEPIVGNWQWTTNDVTKIYKFYFFPDGRYSYTDPINNITLSGTWITIRENMYNVTYSDGKTQTFVYNRTTDTFTIPEFSQVLGYRLGKEPIATFLTPIPPESPSSLTPIITVHTTAEPTTQNNLGSTNKVPLYLAGDLITDSNDISKGKWVILNYNQGTDQYELDQIYKNSDNTWGFRIHESSIIQSRSNIEKSLPSKFGHIAINLVKIDNYDNYINSDVKMKKPLTEVNSDLRYNVLRDLIVDGKKLKEIADEEYLKFNPTDEYAKYLFSVAKLGHDLNTWGTAYQDNQKNVALAYADNSLRDIQEIDVILSKMKSSDRYSSFSEFLQDQRDFFDEMKGNIIDSKDYTSYWMR